MDWRSRSQDASTNVCQLLNWIERDMGYGDRQSFYFLHLNDAHYPYYPPADVIPPADIDYKAMQELIDVYHSSPDYLSLIEDGGIDIDERLLGLAREYYDCSLGYVANQLERFVLRLDSLGILEESFVIITGDHGDDFAEHGTLFHASLYDANIRPGLIVSPPTDSDIHVPDEADLIDLFPTLLESVGAAIPDHCRGASWYSEYDSSPRVTECFRHSDAKRYQVSVERGGWKAIFTYRGVSPDRPDESHLSEGHEHEEFFRIDDSADPRDRRVSDVPSDIRSELLELNAEFASSASNSNEEGIELEDSVQARLAQLGYRER